MASSEQSSSPPRQGGKPVDPSCPKMFKLIGKELEDTRDRVKKLLLKITELTDENHVLKLLRIKNDKLTEDLAFQINRVSCYVKVEAYLRNQIVEEQKKCLAYKKSSNIVKDLIDQQEINRKVGIGFEYNESVGKPSNITPFKVSAKERGIPQVIKNSPKPLFITPIVEPILESSIIIDYEMNLEDLEEEKKREEKRRGKQHVETVGDIQGVNVQKEKWAPRRPVTHVGTSVSPNPGIGASDLKKNQNRPNKFVNSRNSNNRFHSTENFTRAKQVEVEIVKTPTVLNILPTIDACHKPCGVVNCMLCAFNEMSAYFKSMHASNNNTTPRQHINHKHARSKTASPSASQKKTYSPKSVHKVVKTVYKEKCSVKAKADTVKLGTAVKPNKGQFFKYVGPNQVWVPKKI